MKNNLNSLIVYIVILVVLVITMSASSLRGEFQGEGETTGTPDAEGMVFVNGGCFDMGDIFKDGDPDEKPVHKVCVNDFYIGMYEVTQRQWFHVMKTHPSSFVRCDECPVENVSYLDVQEFIKKLNRTSVKEYRLPTEPAWEYAARGGGQRHKWSGAVSENELNDYSWLKTNSDNKPHPVGQKGANGLGLYDMCGNIQEWVSDYYEGEYYSTSPMNNPKGPSTSQYRVARGGSFLNSSWGIRTTIRYRSAIGGRGREFGLCFASRTGGTPSAT